MIEGVEAVQVEVYSATSCQIPAVREPNGSLLDRWTALRLELLGSRTDQTSIPYFAHDGKRAACLREAETPNHGLSPQPIG
jgi:hypothetical protein